MKKELVAKYQKLAKTSGANLGEIYCVQTGDNSVASSKLEENQCDCISESLTTDNCDNVITDFRSLNGKPGSTKFDEFWDEVHQLFSE